MLTVCFQSCRFRGTKSRAQVCFQLPAPFGCWDPRPRASLANPNRHRLSEFGCSFFQFFIGDSCRNYSKRIKYLDNPQLGRKWREGLGRAVFQPSPSQPPNSAALLRAWDGLALPIGPAPLSALLSSRAVSTLLFFLRTINKIFVIKQKQCRSQVEYFPGSQIVDRKKNIANRARLKWGIGEKGRGRFPNPPRSRPSLPTFPGYFLLFHHLRAWNRRIRARSFEAPLGWSEIEAKRSRQFTSEVRRRILHQKASNAMQCNAQSWKRDSCLFSHKILRFARSEIEINNFANQGLAKFFPPAYFPIWARFSTKTPALQCSGLKERPWFAHAVFWPRNRDEESWICLIGLWTTHDPQDKVKGARITLGFRDHYRFSNRTRCWQGSRNISCNQPRSQALWPGDDRAWKRGCRATCRATLRRHQNCVSAVATIGPDPWIESLSMDVFDSRTSTGSHCFGISINAHALTCLTRSHGREKRLFSVRVVPWDNYIQFRKSDFRLASVDQKCLCCSLTTL